MKLVPCAKTKGAYLISVTSYQGNLLSGVCDFNVHFPLERELCPFDLALVTSTAIQMVFADTVVVALMSAKNFSRDEYAANHPAGRIGKSLIFKFMSSCQQLNNSNESRYLACSVQRKLIGKKKEDQLPIPPSPSIASLKLIAHSLLIQKKIKIK
ncbi:hypothetical protein MKX01_036237 [Papaver californicum]|nr:hypothetical protein MKX01_036237 [Papaver californicum]